MAKYAISATIALWSSVTNGLPTQESASPTIDKTLVATTLDDSISRRCVKWEINGDFAAAATISVTTNLPLEQDHGVRGAIYKSDGTPVEGSEFLVGETKTLNFNLTTGTYYFLFDLGAEDLGEAVGEVDIHVDAVLTNRLTGSPIRIRPRSEDLPPDPYYPPPSQIYFPGPLPIPATEFTPVRDWIYPRVETMTYLVDWA